MSDFPRGSLNGRLPAYETYRPHFEATRFQIPSADEALCIVCIRLIHLCFAQNRVQQIKKEVH